MIQYFNGNKLQDHDWLAIMNIANSCKLKQDKALPR